MLSEKSSTKWPPVRFFHGSGRKAYHTAGMAAKCQIRYESERLCLSPTCFFVQPWSPGNNQNVLIRAALAITMMRHHRLEAFFGASHHQIKTASPPLSPPRGRQNTVFASLAAGEHVYSEKWPSAVPRRLPVPSGDGSGPPEEETHSEWKCSAWGQMAFTTLCL